MFEDPEEHDEKIIAEDEVEIPYTDENEVNEIVDNIVSELRAFGYFPTVRTISMGGYPGAIEVSGWKQDYTGISRNVIVHTNIKYEIDLGTNVLHLRRTATVSFSSVEQKIKGLLWGGTGIDILEKKPWEPPKIFEPKIEPPKFEPPKIFEPKIEPPKFEPFSLRKPIRDMIG